MLELLTKPEHSAYFPGEDPELVRACLNQVGGWKAWKSQEPGYPTEAMLTYRSTDSGILYRLSGSLDMDFLYEVANLESSILVRSLDLFPNPEGLGRASIWEETVPANTKPRYTETFNILFRRRLWPETKTVHLTVL